MTIPGPWRKSTYSNATDAANPGSCVVFRLGESGTVQVGDSKLGPLTPALDIPGVDLRALAALSR